MSTPTPRFQEIILQAIKKKYPDVVPIRRDILQQLTPKEREFIDKRITHTKNDEVFVRIELDDLISEGIIQLVEKNGFWYWSFSDKVLNPLEYKEVYKKDKRTLRTLVKEVGILEIYDAFSDKAEPSSLHIFTVRRICNAIVDVSENSLSIDIKGDYVNLHLYYHKNGRLTVEDVYKAVELANDILFGDVVKFKDELRYKLGIVPPHFDEVIKVTASAEDGVLAFLKYEVDIQHLERVPPPMMYKPIEVLHIEFDRVKKEFRFFYVADFNKRQYKPKLSLSVVYVISKIVANDNELVKTLLPPNINIALEASSSTYSVGLTITATGVDEIPVSYQFFYQLLTNYLDRVRDRKLRCGLTVGEFLDAIKWNPQDDIDAVLLKLIAAKVEDTKFEKVKSCKKLEGLEDIVILKGLPPLYHILKAQVELVRHQNDDLLKTLKRKLKTQ